MFHIIQFIVVSVDIRSSVSEFSFFFFITKWQLASFVLHSSNWLQYNLHFPSPIFQSVLHSLVVVSLDSPLLHLYHSNQNRRSYGRLLLLPLSLQNYHLLVPGVLVESHHHYRVWLILLLGLVVRFGSRVVVERRFLRQTQYHHHLRLAQCHFHLSQCELSEFNKKLGFVFCKRH